MWSTAKQPCASALARSCASRRCATIFKQQHRFLSTKNPSSSSVTHDEESVQDLANTLRESITRLHQHQDTTQKESSRNSFRRILERARPQLVTMIVSSGALLLGIRSYYFQKTNRVMEEKIEQQRKEIERKNEVLVAVTSDDFVKSLAEKCASAAATTSLNNNNSSTGKSFWGATTKLVGTIPEEASKSVASVLYQILNEELNHRVGDEILSEEEREQRRKEKLEDEELGKKAAIRADNETKLEKLRQSGKNLPENVMQEIKHSSEPFEVTTDESGNKVVRSKVFRI